MAGCLWGISLFQHVPQATFGEPQPSLEAYPGYEDCGRRVLPTPPDCKLELLRFLGLLPLARMDFRLDMHPQVSCSDASTSGGGICASARTFPIRAMVPQGDLRGQWAEPGPEVGVLAIGLFDGI